MNNCALFVATHIDPVDGEEFMRLPDGDFITKEQLDAKDYESAIPFAEGSLELLNEK